MVFLRNTSNLFNVQKPVLNEVKDLSLTFLIDPSKLRMRETRTLNLEH